MRQTGWMILGVLLLLGTLGVAAIVTPSAAQERNPNLLLQASFEDGYTGRGRPDLNVPGEWGVWIADGPREFEWQNRADKVFIFPSRDFRRDGDFSINIDGGYVTYTVALFQQVELLQPGANIRAQASAILRTCNFPRNEANEIIGGECVSSPESGAIVRIGIDPNGGGNPLAEEIVWSEPEEPHQRFMRLTVDATATNNFVTVFLYTTQARPSDLNRVWWDEAELRYGGGGPPTRVPTPTITRDLPLPQPPLPDGTIIHIVQARDTIDGLAMVYGVSQERIIELNNLTDPRRIQVGQQLIIRLPGE